VCFNLLKKTSRSFAAVIEMLDEELRTPVCVFYLVLRALDTVEDDMSIPEGKKKALCIDFYTRLADPASCNKGIKGLGDTPEYRELLMKYASVVRAAHNHCSDRQREVITDITRQMGAGMASFVGKESLTSTAEYDLYCHYVAGLVGIGLSQLWAAASCEGPHMGTIQVHNLSNEMGLFLQKANITRDYLEDVTEGRPWWPREVWAKHAPTAASLQQPERHAAAIACLNELVTDGLEHAPACLHYLALLKNNTVFSFCAVPQVMAIATLA